MSIILNFILYFLLSIDVSVNSIMIIGINSYQSILIIILITLLAIFGFHDSFFSDLSEKAKKNKNKMCVLWIGILSISCMFTLNTFTWSHSNILNCAFMISILPYLEGFNYLIIGVFFPIILYWKYK